MKTFLAVAVGLAVGVAAFAARPILLRLSSDPFPTPIPAVDGAIRVHFTEFATLPDIDTVPARMMLLVHEPGTDRLFVNDQRGVIYAVSNDGQVVTPYLTITDPTWGVPVQAQGRERGFQSFAFHPEFARAGSRGFGKFYTYLDTTNQTPVPAFRPKGSASTHDIVLLEWTAKTPGAATYDGERPREMIRIRHPFANHNGGMTSFNPTAASDSPDYGLLYVGSADGGSGGDPQNAAQDLGSIFGKILRIDPLGTNSANGKYGIPASNPLVQRSGALPEIYAYGVRNPQRFGWDSKNGTMFMSDIGQNTIEKVSTVTAGANLGWNIWEGSFTFSREGVGLANQRGDSTVTYPVVEYAQSDPLLQSGSAATGVVVSRSGAIPQLENQLIFGDLPSGEIFYVSADRLPSGGQDAIRRILLVENGADRTFLQIIRAKNAAQGRPQVSRADLRFGTGPNGQIFLLNKGDGTIRLLQR